MQNKKKLSQTRFYEQNLWPFFDRIFDLGFLFVLPCCIIPFCGWLIPIFFQFKIYWSHSYANIATLYLNNEIILTTNLYYGFFTFRFTSVFIYFIDFMWSVWIKQVWNTKFELMITCNIALFYWYEYHILVACFIS